MSMLAKNNKVESWVRSYDEILKIQEQIEVLLDKQNILSNGILSNYINIYKIQEYLTKQYSEESRKKGFKNILKRYFWESIISKTRISELITSKINNQLNTFRKDAGKLEFNNENIYEVFRLISNSQEGIVVKSVKEIFELMTYYHKNRKYGGYKTNHQFKVGEKVILTCNPSSEIFVDIDKTLCMITGKNYKNIIKLKDILMWFSDRKEQRNKSKLGTKVDTEFFIVKQFKNGNTHLQWKDLSIRDLFNRIYNGGSNQLGTNL